ncbi:MAG TPA: Gfo/Idh/MocA family oxidoreductase [Candidatus Hydrogenedentes bacterium]|nr:Gfo/Idh/MocA family oxidoreductase [Candidatus Hydrogenedentota bacterium]HPG66217.1 Gfo/Idh/MocA family oxidoreductase [Candidatus Hydrogenedentota bacterium]
MQKHTENSRSAARAVSRRSFLRSSAVAAGVATVGAPAIARGQNLNEKLHIAIIGAGGRGGGNMDAVSSENIVALCDVNQANLDAAAAKHPQARKVVDFRDLYDYADEFDAVVVSTCEHTHAFATLPALQLGKHVYCEKPLTHSAWEARIIREAAAKAKVATQMGTQIHAGDNYRRVVELIQTGAIGPVREVHVWVGRAWGWHATDEACQQANDIVCVRERPAEAQPVPEGLNWDLWLGPAPERPFNEVYFPGPKWYRWWDFGNGTMSDLGSHWIDLPFWALKLDHPLTIESDGAQAHAEIAPASMHVVYEYGPRGDLPPLTLTWYQGTHKPAPVQEGVVPAWDSGVLFVGENGMLLSDYSKHVLLPEDTFADFKRPEPFIPASLGHHAEWIHACKTGEPTTCNFTYAGWLTEANHLGNVAYRVGKKLEWDPENLRATNTPEADRFIRREYRAPWKLV